MKFRNAAAACIALVPAATIGLIYHAASAAPGNAQRSAAASRVQREALNAGPTTTTASFFGGARAHSQQVQLIVRHVALPFQTTYMKSARLLPGRQWVWKPGQPGLRRDYVRVVTEGNQVVSRSVVNSRLDRQPANRVVIVGVDPFNASRSLGMSGRVFTMLASKYDMYLRDIGGGGPGTGITATGVRARRGIVAVDPRVIPMGTRLYVEGYGYCVAADTGGAIKGRRIDLCVETPGEANAYGIRPVRVMIVP